MKELYIIVICSISNQVKEFVGLQGYLQNAQHRDVFVPWFYLL